MKIFPHLTATSFLLSASLSFGAEKSTLVEMLKNEFGLKAENIIQPQSKNETYISQIEECGLVTCYKHNIVLAKNEKGNTYFISTLRTGEVVPFSEKTKISNGNKKVSKKSKAKISKAILDFDSSATIILDDEDSDADVDCSTQFREIAAYGGSIEPVSKDIGTPKITYFSRDYLLTRY